MSSDKLLAPGVETTNIHLRDVIHLLAIQNLRAFLHNQTTPKIRVLNF